MVKESSFLYQTRQILSPSDVYEMIKEQVEGLDCEQFIIACLNTKNEPTNITVVSVGSLNKAIIHPKKCLKQLSYQMLLVLWHFIIIHQEIQHHLIKIFN
nr:JAB domain-containing protein [Turicibacter sanguinis]